MCISVTLTCTVSITYLLPHTKRLMLHREEKYSQFNYECFTRTKSFFKLNNFIELFNFSFKQKTEYNQWYYQF